MQLQLVLEGRPRHEPLQFRHPHVRHILEHHMLAHRFDRRVDFRAGKSQAFHDSLRHLGADSIVPVETDAAIFIHG